MPNSKIVFAASRLKIGSINPLFPVDPWKYPFSVIPSLSATGFLPLGRYQATLDEIHGRYVEEISSDRRTLVWEHFENVFNLVSAVIPICSIWIAGSFVSDKLSPSDIDLFFIFKDSDINARIADGNFVSMMIDLGNNSLGTNQNWLIDTRWMPWVPNQYPFKPPALTEHYAARGFWDEFWSRRYRVKGQQHPDDANLKQGYLEVILNGFTV